MEGTIESLATEEWHYQPRVEDAEADIVKPHRDAKTGRQRGWIGPLVTVKVGCTEEDEDGEEGLSLDGQDGRNLIAIAALPQFALLVTWTRDQLKALEEVHFDATTHDRIEKFHRELRDRLNYIIETINERDPLAYDCEGGSMVLSTFDNPIGGPGGEKTFS